MVNQPWGDSLRREEHGVVVNILKALGCISVGIEEKAVEIERKDHFPIPGFSSSA